MNVKRQFFLTGAVLSGLTLVSLWFLFISRSPELTRAAGGIHTVCLAGPPLCDYSVIQDAVDAAGDGDVIKVAAGTYDDVNNYSDLAQVVYINKSVTIQGGYTTSFTEPPDPGANPTTLDAGGQGRVIYIEGNNINPTIEGLRITGGNASVLDTILGGPVTGGGVQIYSAAATLRNNQIFNNTAYDGGGLRLDNSAAILEENNIFSNTADNGGGGLFLSFSPAILNRNHISDNTASSGAGGGLFIDYSTATLNNNTIASNTAVGGGGLSINESDDIRLSANTIISNTASESIGGLGCHNGQNARISGNTFSYNSAPYAGGLVIGCTGFLSNNLISNNTANQGAGLVACNISIERNTIVENSAIEGGGGIFLWNCDETTLKGNTISENTAGWGAGVQMGFGEYILINNMIVNNHVTEPPPKFEVMLDTSTAYLLHNTLAGNNNSDDTGIWVDSDSTIAMTNTIIVSYTVGIQVDGTATIESTLWGSGTWANTADWSGTGTINHNNDYWGNPDFVDYLAGDYHIGENSDAIDAGIDAGVTRDIDNHPRPYQLPDIGADEYWPPGVLKYIYLPLTTG